MNYTIWVSVLILFLLLFIGVQYLDLVKKESMRTLYMPTSHPIVQYVKPNYYGGSYSTETMNQWIDHYIASYFDDANVPYLNTIDLYIKYVVNKGVLKQEYKNKMRDMCHYIINIVIPNLPTAENPDPHIEWPMIEWLSDDWKAYNYSFNLDAIANLFGGTTSYKKRPVATTSESPTPESTVIESPGSESPGANPSATSNSPDPSGSTTSSGGACNSCPTDCFDKLLSTLNKPDIKSSSSPGVDASSSPGSESKTESRGTYKSSTGQEHVDSSGPEESGIITVDQVIVTNETVINPSSQELNHWVFNKMNAYVDMKYDLYPTKQAQLDFVNFIRIYGPIDREHKNKLRDLVYYFMENIIPGLPTESKPVCYVEWRPIRWLANSNL
jgi:hypothetical protein